MKKRSGQILILVLLVVVVALAIGLSVASRNLTNLRTSTQTEQSQRAFSAAEGGVEDTLSNLTAIKNDPNIATPTGINRDVAVGQITANVNVKAANVYEAVIDEGTVGQITLVNTDASSWNGTLTVEWILQADTQTENITPKASVEISFVCQSTSCVTSSGTGIYTQHRAAYEAETISGQEGFSACIANPPGDKYLCRTTFAVASGNSAKVLRIRPFWRKTTVRVTGVPALPVQAYDVVSTATTPDLGITRRVQVTRTALPQLPASFDYVLFSETDIIK